MVAPAMADGEPHDAVWLFDEGESKTPKVASTNISHQPNLYKKFNQITEDNNKGRKNEISKPHSLLARNSSQVSNASIKLT